MSAHSSSRLAAGTNLIGLIARCLLGGAMIYFGLMKATAPAGFLKALREYELTQNPVLLNFVAGTLPWMEILCGALLLCGIAVRGTAVITGVMLTVFTLLVFVRASAIYQTGNVLFCGIKFDCGCGNGEVMICRKLLENGALILFSMLACRDSASRFSVRHKLINSWARPKAEPNHAAGRA